MSAFSLGSSLSVVVLISRENVCCLSGMKIMAMEGSRVLAFHGLFPAGKTLRKNFEV
jgi:hypothetical protein